MILSTFPITSKIVTNTSLCVIFFKISSPCLVIWSTKVFVFHIHCIEGTCLYLRLEFSKVIFKKIRSPGLNLS